MAKKTANKQGRNGSAKGNGTSDISRSLGTFFDELRNYPPLTREQEQQLAKQGDEKSLSKLVCHNLSYVVKVAASYRDLGLPLKDLISEGAIGLIEASRRFDWRKGNKFITYATWWIRKSILRALAEQVKVVQVSAYHRRLLKQIHEGERILHNELHRKPERHEISDRIDVSLDRIETTLQFRAGEVSVDAPTNNDSAKPISESMEDKSIEDPCTQLIRKEGAGTILSLVNQLPELEWIVIRHRFGVDGYEQMTLTDIGRYLGLSRERVRQIETNAKMRLRQLLARAQRRTKRNSNPLQGTPASQNALPTSMQELTREKSLVSPVESKRHKSGPDIPVMP